MELIFGVTKPRSQSLDSTGKIAHSKYNNYKNLVLIWTDLKYNRTLKLVSSSVHALDFLYEFIFYVVGI